MKSAEQGPQRSAEAIEGNEVEDRGTRPLTFQCHLTMPGLRGFTGSLAILWNDRLTGRRSAWRELCAAPHAARPVGEAGARRVAMRGFGDGPVRTRGGGRWGDAMGIHDLWLFVIAGLLLNITPGPTWHSSSCGAPSLGHALERPQRSALGQGVSFTSLQRPRRSEADSQTESQDFAPQRHQVTANSPIQSALEAV